MAKLKSSIKILLLLIAGAVAVVLIYAATKPDDFRVERKLEIAAPADSIFTQINDFHKWSAWSPWKKLDLNMKKTYGGTEMGKGAKYAWEGNKDVGKGKMEILVSIPPSRIKIKLDFLEPFEAHNTTEFSITPSAKGAMVVWSMYGPSSYLSKVMSVFFNMDKMIGNDFEAGLQSLEKLTVR